MVLYPARIIPDEGDDSCVVRSFCKIQAGVRSYFIDNFCNLVILPQELCFNDQFHRRDEKVCSGLLLAERLEIFLVLNIGENRRQQKIKKVLNVIFMVNVPSPGLPTSCLRFVFPRPSAKASRDAVKKVNDIR